MEADLVDVLHGRARPAAEQVEALLRFLRPTLDDAAEWDEVSELVHATLGQGTGSSRQRKAHHRAGSFDDVMDLVVAETLR